VEENMINDFMCEMALKGTMIIFIAAALFAFGAFLYITVKEGILQSVRHRDAIETMLTSMIAALIIFSLICFIFNICPLLLRF